MPHDNPSSQPGRAAMGCASKVVLVLLAVAAVGSLALLWVYGLDSHHETRNTIWPEEGRRLIPPAATNITFERDLLDHRATYTIAEADLNAFLDGHFGSGGDLDSYSERDPMDSESFEEKYGFLGWTWTDGIARYDYATSNGAVSSYIHDPATGLTYQTSAYW